MSDRRRAYMESPDNMAYDAQREMRSYGPPADKYYPSLTDRPTEHGAPYPAFRNTGYEPPADYSRHRAKHKRRRKKRFVDDFQNLDFSNYTEYGEDYYEYYEGDHPPEKDEQAELEDTFRDLFMKIDRGKRIEIGHQIEDMLISCSFDGYKCYAENFTIVSDGDFGNCYTLSPNYISKKSGPMAGLSIILYMELEEYLEGISQGYGVRVVIHERKSFPFPADRGIYLAPSFESHIGLKLTNISREGDPYGKCNDGAAYTQQYGIKYTRMVCQALCRQTEVYRRCGCYDEDDEELFHFIHKLENKFCRTKNQYICMDKVNHEFDKKEISCTCEDPCYEQKYTLYPSYRVWPTDQYAILLQEGVCDKLPPAKCKRIVETTDPRELGQNFLKFVIYYEDLNFEEFDEEPEIEDAQFVSDVGGAIGLWIGLSLLAIFEVIQFFFELGIFGCRVCCHKDDKKNQGKKKQKKKIDGRPQNGGPVHNQTQIPQWNKTNRNGEFDNINFSRASPQNRWGYDY
ncbi:hypothetical protein FSP39_006902 [Pinctada imbricata]|uniref:Uncharacterized protein n=1 Tax=Pinctada imbricata TaxID=66713 RepID=A0AA89BIY3_PINIB|nr:hypothetical protein FSP39_006902 [Pinctada imbricata]